MPVRRIMFKERAMYDNNRVTHIRHEGFRIFGRNIDYHISSGTCHRMLENWYVLALIMIGIRDNCLDILSRNVFII